MNREELSAQEFSYDLPDERIAKYPLANRDRSKILIYQNQNISEDHFFNLNRILPKDSVLVFNNTKVLAARLNFKKDTGAKIEIFCLEPYQSTVEQALSASSECKWQCMVGNLKRFKADDVLSLEIAGTSLQASIFQKEDREVVVQFKWEGGIPFSDILAEAGEVPLPPYLKRKADETDRESYQTVYAEEEGAVAAPTAGLHFTNPLLKELKQQGHELAYLTLFVGAGTFRPVKSEKLSEHQMHAERIVISKKLLELLQNKAGKIISVGTTSLRSLESLYWLAVKRYSGDANADFISQDDAYELNDSFSWKEACEFLIADLNKRGEENLDFHSALFIMPSYRWQSISGLITNFHQPQSTLLALVAAWIGSDWKKVYQYALENDFRFLSYGDSSILMRGE